MIVRNLDPSTVLVVIDVQKAIDHPSWGERNNPQAERNIRALLQAWRGAARPIYHIRHDSTEAGRTIGRDSRETNSNPRRDPCPEKS